MYDHCFDGRLLQTLYSFYSQGSSCVTCSVVLPFIKDLDTALYYTFTHYCWTCHTIILLEKVHIIYVIWAVHVMKYCCSELHYLCNASTASETGTSCILWCRYLWIGWCFQSKPFKYRVFIWKRNINLKILTHIRILWLLNLTIDIWSEWVRSLF